jgi:hypothetical protein
MSWMVVTPRNSAHKINPFTIFCKTHMPQWSTSPGRTWQNKALYIIKLIIPFAFLFTSSCLVVSDFPGLLCKSLQIIFPITWRPFSNHISWYIFHSISEASQIPFCILYIQLIRRCTSETSEHTLFIVIIIEIFYQKTVHCRSTRRQNHLVEKEAQVNFGGDEGRYLPSRHLKDTKKNILSWYGNEKMGSSTYTY